MEPTQQKPSTHHSTELKPMTHLETQPLIAMDPLRNHHVQEMERLLREMDVAANKIETTPKI